MAGAADAIRFTASRSLGLGIGRGDRTRHLHDALGDASRFEADLRRRFPAALIWPAGLNWPAGPSGSCAISAGRQPDLPLTFAARVSGARAGAAKVPPGKTSTYETLRRWSAECGSRCAFAQVRHRGHYTPLLGRPHRASLGSSASAPCSPPSTRRRPPTQRRNKRHQTPADAGAQEPARARLASAFAGVTILECDNAM